jgi:hypothetical protein
MDDYAWCLLFNTEVLFLFYVVVVVVVDVKEILDFPETWILPRSFSRVIKKSFDSLCIIKIYFKATPTMVYIIGHCRDHLPGSREVGRLYYFVLTWKTDEKNCESTLMRHGSSSLAASCLETTHHQSKGWSSARHCKQGARVDGQTKVLLSVKNELDICNPQLDFSELGFFQLGIWLW